MIGRLEKGHVLRRNNTTLKAMPSYTNRAKMQPVIDYHLTLNRILSLGFIVQL